MGMEESYTLREDVSADSVSHTSGDKASLEARKDLEKGRVDNHSYEVVEQCLKKW